MNLISFSLGAVPDVATGRRLHDLGDLSDADAAKVLFHRRKQETGHSEALRPNLQRIAALAMVHEGSDGPTLVSRNWRDGGEAELLDTLLEPCKGLGTLVSWGGDSLPLLGYRALKYARHARVFGLRSETAYCHCDLQAELSHGQARACAPLHEIAHLMELPGVEPTPVDAWEALLADQPEPLMIDLELRAIHIYLIGLRQVLVAQQRTEAQVEETITALHSNLEDRREPHLQHFLQVWGAN